MTALPLVIIGPAAALAVALGLLAAGLRGRRQDDHPICRRCRFDLFNRPASSTRCPECGADLTSHRATRVGNRERSRGTIWLAMLLLVPAALWLGGVAWVGVSGVKIVRHKPVWWLLSEGHSRDPATRSPALLELQRRLGDGTLTDGQFEAVIDRALDVQADERRPWDPNWGVLVEQAHQRKRLPADRWARYARQATRPLIELEGSRVTRGSGLPIRLSLTPPRAGPKSPLCVRWSISHVSFATDGIWRQQRGSIRDLRPGPSGGLLVEFPLPGYEIQRLPAGSHRLRLPVLMSMEQDVPGQRFVTTPIEERTVELEAQWELLEGE